MFVPLAIGSVLFSVSLASGLASGLPSGLVPTPSTSDATITPAPHLELLKKQNDDRYMGYISYDGAWHSEQCNLGGTYYQTSDYWRCCTTTANGCGKAQIPIGCISGSLIYQQTVSTLSQTLFTYACTSIFTGSSARSYTICNTLFMYENDGDTSPLTNVNCGAYSSRWSYYRVAPYAATAISSESPTVQSSSAVSNPTIPPTPDPVPNPVPTPPEPKTSKAWIAGAVVGPLIGLALIGLAAFLFLRHKKNKQPQSHPGAGAPLPEESKQPFSPGPNSPPQYYAPMHQNTEAAGAVPFGVAKHESWVGPQSPNTTGSLSPNPQGSYGAPPQQGWQDHNNLHINQAAPMGGQPGYGPPSPSMSPPPGHVQPAPYGGETGMFKHTGETTRNFSSELEGSNVHNQPESVQPRNIELEGSNVHSQPENVNVQPKN